MTRLETLQAVFAEQEQREADMAFRNPWVPLFYNWLIAIALLTLAFSFCKWGWTIHKTNRETAIREQAVAEYQAEAQAAADAAAKEKADKENSEANSCAKALYGIRLFVEKYNYSEADLKTYLRSAFNRVDATGASLEEVLFGGQYLASSMNNTVLTEYREISETALQEWHSEAEKPCDLSYQFAELTPSGIYLKTDINADGYAKRWRAE